MSKNQRVSSGRLGLLVASVVVATVLVAALPAMAAKPCCFNNRLYTGTCQVMPGSDETCSSILGYLNNPNSVGKQYCGNTKIRGGWSEVSCNAKSTATTGAAAPEAKGPKPVVASTHPAS
jgi:hypothetical protein